MKLPIASIAFVLVACTNLTTQRARNPASVQADVHIIDRALAPTDNLDGKFENVWVSPQDEKDALRKLAELNGGFVQSANDQYVKWSRQAAQHPNAGDRVAQVLNDFPARENGQYATRAVHKKNHGCYPAKVVFNDQAPDVGYYRKQAEYDAIIRFSNGNARTLLDSDLDGRGMAVKILPDGALNSAMALSAQALNASTLLNMSHVNFPVPFMFDPVEYYTASSIGLKEYSTPNPTIAPLFSQLLAGQKVSLRTRVLAGTMTSTVLLNPLYQNYYSMSAARLGSSQDEPRTAIKSEFSPCVGNVTGPESPDWTWSPVHRVNVDFGLEPISGFTYLPAPGYLKFLASSQYAELNKNPDFLRFAAQRTLQQDGFCFDMKVQYYIDAQQTPIEDATEVWLENEDQRKTFINLFGRLPASAHGGPVTPLADRKITPSVTIAKITIPKLSAEDIGRINSRDFQSLCEDLSFNTWDNVPEEHKPLGIVPRMRWHAYRASGEMRRKINDVR